MQFRLVENKKNFENGMSFTETLIYVHNID